jgi:hypothetical protein
MIPLDPSRRIHFQQSVAHGPGEDGSVGHEPVVARGGTLPEGDEALDVLPSAGRPALDAAFPPGGWAIPLVLEPGPEGAVHRLAEPAPASGLSPGSPGLLRVLSPRSAPTNDGRQLARTREADLRMLSDAVVAR